ncbi:MAG: NFACT family protein [Nitrososphaerales archaeon]|nr:NFACT family protein [Nitrososphaerales archaeon]
MGELSGIDILPLVREIDETLRGTYVNNVFSIGSGQVLRFRRPGSEDSMLVVSPRFGAWISEKVAERTETTDFTSKLRAQVGRSKFVGAGQTDLDRIFDITLGEGDSLRHLVLELMPPGNIVVTDGEGKIQLLLKEVRSTKRRLSRGGRYTPPPQGRQSPEAVTEEDVRQALDREKTVGSAIGRHVALPKKYVREVLRRVDLEELTDSRDLLGRAGEIAKAIGQLVKAARDAPSPCLAETDGGEEIFAVQPTGIAPKELAASVSVLCDEIFLPAILTEASSKPDPEDERRREIEVTIGRLENQEKEMTVKAQMLRELAGRAKASRNLTEALKLLAEAGDSGSRVLQAPESREAVSSRIYGWAKDAERKAAEAKAAAATLSRKNVSKGASRRKATTELRRKSGEWYEKFRWFMTTGGKLAIGGRDAQSNALLVRRHLDDGDTVYHADLFGSPFFVLKGGKGQTPAEVLEVAQATVTFSSAWKTGLGAADAYWVVKEQIGTAAPSGQYLAKGSFMITGKKNKVEHCLVEAAVGIDHMGRVVSGPESAIAASAIAYLVLVPHREKASQTASRVARDLALLTVLDAKINLDDVLRALPPGGGKVTRKGSPHHDDKPK